MPPDVELIVATAGEVVNDADRAKTLHARMVACGLPNRGAQMNSGAALARGQTLLFHHADSLLGHAHLDALRTAMRRADFVGGAFHREFDDRHPIMKRVEPLERWRCVHGKALFGDQSIFVRRDVFNALGGYAEIPLMEDFEFSRRLRAAGKLDILDPPMLTSARHHDTRGPWRTSFRNLLFIVLYRCGVSPWRLHRWYYRGQPVAVARSEPQPPSCGADPRAATRGRLVLLDELPVKAVSPPPTRDPA